MMHRKRRLLWVILVLAVYLTAGNCIPLTTGRTLSSPLIPGGFDGMRILHITDLHDALLGPGQCFLRGIARQAEPDLIVITGDFIDSSRIDIGRSVQAARVLRETAPVYYVTGNQEGKLSDEVREAFFRELEENGVQILRDEAVILHRGEDQLRLIGMNDPAFQNLRTIYREFRAMRDALAAMTDDQTFDLVLAHRPELAEYYEEAGADAVLCGHTHGGQIWIPFLGGLYAPSQGWLPRYTAGAYQRGMMQMLVSRGLGNSAFPLRINNFPEAVLITLRSAQAEDG